MLFVEAARTIITCAAKQKYLVRPACGHLHLSPGKQFFAESGSVSDGQHEKQVELTAFPRGETASSSRLFRNQTTWQKFRGTPLEVGNIGMNAETESSVALKQALVPNASERRNVSGARPSDRYAGGGAQRPSTAFAMMLRWTSFEPAKIEVLRSEK